MYNLHLFAGIGGGILADVILGNTIAAAVEIEGYCREILRKNQENGFLNRFEIYEDVRQFDGNQYRNKIDTVCGGFPCQDISAAGRGAGINGEKSGLFYELIRICANVRPRYIFLENSPCITSRGLDTVLGKIAEVGYDAEWSTLSAGAVGAPHLRERWWCLCKRQDVQPEEVSRDIIAIEDYWRRVFDFTNYGWKVCNADGKLLEFSSCNDRATQTRNAATRCSNSNNGTTPAALCGFPQNGADLVGDCRRVGRGWWETEPRLGRVVDGVPHWMERIKGLGNAQVPVVAALAFYLLLSRYCE